MVQRSNDEHRFYAAEETEEDGRQGVAPEEGPEPLQQRPANRLLAVPVDVNGGQGSSSPPAAGPAARPAGRARSRAPRWPAPWGRGAPSGPVAPRAPWPGPASAPRTRTRMPAADQACS